MRQSRDAHRVVQGKRRVQHEEGAPLHERGKSADDEVEEELDESASKVHTVCPQNHCF